MNSFQLLSLFLAFAMANVVEGRKFKFRAKGTSFPDVSFCYPAIYSNKEGDEDLGTLLDCVTSEIEFLDGGVARFQLTSIFTPFNENYELVTQCDVTVTPDAGLAAPFNAREECYNENGVISGGTGSVSLMGVVDNSQVFVTGQLTFDIFWTIVVD